MTTTLNPTPVATIKALVDDLARLDVTPLHLHVDTLKVGDLRPNVSLWTQTRTDFETLCDAWKMKPVERTYTPEGQRAWCAERDTNDRRLLVQCVSFAHHDDWQPRGTATKEGALW